MKGRSDDWPDHFAIWLKEIAAKLRLVRDAVQQDLVQGALPNALPDAVDAGTILALAPPLSKAMAGLSKSIAASRPKRAKSKSQHKTKPGS